MSDNKMDFVKTDKSLYEPREQPSLIEVPAMKFIMVDGKGDPNQDGGEYQQAVVLLYALAYTIKMSKMSGHQPPDYYEYTVPPLEGLWWFNDQANFDFTRKNEYVWTSMIRQPEFVTPEFFAWACQEAGRKKKGLQTEKARLQVFQEGLCVQVMHIGPFDAEPATVATLDAFIHEHNLQNAIGEIRPNGLIGRHHEIYLGDPRKTAPEKLRTIIRHPVRVMK